MSQASPDDPVPLGRRLVNSPAFSTLFREGMALVERTATYLDGPGRAESKALERIAALTYATESMRLTTRLMQMASWLLLQRAVNEGELTQEQAAKEKTKVRLADTSARDLNDVSVLPETLRELIDASWALHERIRHLDRAVYEDAPVQPVESNPVSGQLARLRSAFETGR
jgi:regulator of CtrA degradation